MQEEKKGLFIPKSYLLVFVGSLVIAFIGGWVTLQVRLSTVEHDFIYLKHDLIRIERKLDYLEDKVSGISSDIGVLKDDFNKNVADIRVELAKLNGKKKK
jgi:hypothetical protein